MEVNRREALVLGAFGAAGAAGLALPFGGAVSASSASQLAARHMPIPFATRFTRQPVLAGQLRGHGDRFRILVNHQQAALRPQLRQYPACVPAAPERAIQIGSIRLHRQALHDLGEHHR